MKQAIIRPDDLIKYMGEDKYIEFLNMLTKRHKIANDLPLWIILEWGGEIGF